MLSNITIGRVTIILTVLLAFLNTVVMMIIYASGYFEKYGLQAIFCFLIISVIFSFIALKIFIDNFVLNKIRLIYKMIDDSRKSYALSEVGGLENKPLAEVNNEVMEWAEKREKEIVQLKELEDYRKSFLGNISHELKTPLFSIQGYIHTLIEGGVYDEKINLKYLKRSAANIDRLQGIVDDLEIINQLQSGRVSLVLENFDIKDLVEEVRVDLQMMAEDEGMEISYLPDAKRSFKVNAEKDKIRQVLVNLVTNAIKYGKEGKCVLIGFYAIDDKILVEVSDKGPGIEEKHLKHLFDRFYRVESSGSRKYGGSGLGLSIVKHIIETHNQTISVRSIINEGTTFSFTLAKA